MIKRLLLGLFLGLVVGGIVAAVLTQALGITFVGAGAFFAYIFAGLTGILTGLVAGKPIWHQTGKIESGLKAFFGALIAMGLMFAVRKWLNVQLDLTALKAGVGPVGDLPLVALPMISGVLGAFFEADNTPEADDAGADKFAKKDGKSGASIKARVPAKGSAVSSSPRALDDGDEFESVANKKKR